MLHSISEGLLSVVYIWGEISTLLPFIACSCCYESRIYPKLKHFRFWATRICGAWLKTLEGKSFWESSLKPWYFSKNFLVKYFFQFYIKILFSILYDYLQTFQTLILTKKKKKKDILNHRKIQVTFSVSTHLIHIWRHFFKKKREENRVSKLSSL